MGKLIGSGNTDNYGENLFVDKAREYLDDSNIIYWNRQVFGREFDVCILMPEKGILVVELKGWREENILRVENNESIVIKTADGEVPSSPQKQARGYRFTLERYIRQSINKQPLVFQMVCLPRVSKSFYKSHRLDVVTEEKFTILKEDLKDTAAFFAKLDQALREASKWNRAPFDRRTMLEVRNLFETDIELDETQTDQSQERVSYHERDYSRFYFIGETDPLRGGTIEEMTSQYMQGCKLYCVFSNGEQMRSVAAAIDSELSRRGLVRSRDNIEIAFEETKEHLPKLTPESRSFTAFHCSMSVLSEPLAQPESSFMIKNGAADSSQKALLRELGAKSQFNAEQYFIEHAAPEKNIIIRAGAGTGKTYTMISRIGFICYSQNVPLQTMADRIVMITFTNEAADQMEEKIKAYFRNCYLITSRVEYLHMIAQVDHMQISTIHAYAKGLIAQLGTSFGYGVDVGITSSDFYRRKKISAIIDSYIQQKTREYGIGYTGKLGLPVYAIRDNILDFIGKLHNKSVDIGAVEAADFGSLPPDDPHGELHELLAAVIPAVEKEYFQELLEDDKLHLSSMMALLNRFISAPENQKRIRELRNAGNALQFMFVDEFQDTDDSQIDSLLAIAAALNYRLFVVGDIKQCIYRFRGAKEKAFDRLKIGENPSAWLEFSLQRNYRTDTTLLNLFDRSFSAWGKRQDELLVYDPQKDRLLGTKDCNSYLLSNTDRFFKKLCVSNEALRIPKLVEEIQRIQRRIRYEEEQRHMDLPPKERSIAILVRENWQAELVRMECAKLLPDVTIQTNTGGDLYVSQPALDMLALVNALVHFDEAEYLYNLVASNFFNLDIPKSNLFEIRMKIKTGGWRTKADEREQINYMISYMNHMLVNPDDQNYKWESIVTSLRTKPVLQVIRRIYSVLKPWQNYSDDAWKQHYYKLNVDLLFEQLINACNVDRLTINTLQEHLYNCIVSKASVDSRIPASNTDEMPIQCITVHKSKGLEYGHVILPFCSAPIDYIKRSQLHISATKSGEHYRIGYSMSLGDSRKVIQNDNYDESVEKSEKSREETRILYVAMTRAIRSFSWIEISGNQTLSWQKLIETEAKNHAV